jgi:Icc-related predicted phosphoesterase
LAETCFLRGDPPAPPPGTSFLRDYLLPHLAAIRDRLGEDFPSIFLILGNDDPRCEAEDILSGETQQLWHYVHDRHARFGEFFIRGCAYVPPTPFSLKDWERYDVSRHVDPLCVSPEKGCRSVPVSAHELKWGTIRKHLAAIPADFPTDRAIFLFHTPPYDTPLDLADLGGRRHEHVVLDVHIGSVAVREFIEPRQPLISLHGHAHESTRLSGTWQMQIGRTVSINAAHDGRELALVRFDPDKPGAATRELL